jgi:uncharacterized protein (DUF924 family)
MTERERNEIPADAGEVLDFWFGPLKPDGTADAEHSKRWWTKDPDFDREIAKRFGPLREAAVRGEKDGWLESTRARLALVIVLDQFSRNMFRGDPKSFDGDARALEVALETVERGDDRKLGPDERTFLYMPLMHSEDPFIQERSVAMFSALAAELSGEAKKAAENTVEFAKKHREVVLMFGRFPHRNAVLGRTTTADEMAFIVHEGSSF